MAKTLSFDTGLIEYDINGVSVRFNPTDEGFVDKLEKMVESIGNMQGRLSEGSGFAVFAKLDAETREKVDALLGDGTSDALFPSMNCWALSDGLPVWLNLAIALMDEVTEAYEREFGKTDPRVKAHKAKYAKMMAKYRKPKGKK
jgi:hypothetical protein